MMNKHTEDRPALACDLTALEPVQREQHLATAKQLFAAVQATEELPNGYAFRLPEEPEMWLKAVEFIAHERLCCPFFGFALEIEPEGGPLWLKLTGREGIKPFIQAEFGL